ncbi:MAG: glycosyltransferase family 4 protein [Henriciella sp.]
MSKLNRIVVLHDTLDAIGGATSLARLSAIRYRAMGYDVVFITGVPDDGSLSEYGIETIGLGQAMLRQQPRFEAITSGLYNSHAAKRVSQWIKRNDTDSTAYHLHNWAQILSPGIFSALSPVANRTVVSCHDLFNACPNGGLLHFPTGAPCSLKPMSKECWLSQCDRRGTVHKYWRMLRQVNLNRLARFDESEMTFVSLHEGMTDLLRSVGFNPPLLTSVPNPASAYTNGRVPCEQNKPFLFVGRLSAEKGADIALKEAHQAGVPMMIIGEGDLEDELKAKYPEAEFAGFCDHAAIEKYAQKARGIIVPSRVREPFGLVVAEAALSGIPVLISKQSMLSGEINSREMGSVFDPLKPGDLAGRLSSWTKNDELTRTMSENAFANAHAICSSPDDWAQKFIDIMQARIGSATGAKTPQMAI